MRIVRKLWNSIKRNPVINLFALTVLGQFSHDYLAGNVNLDNIVTYIATMALGVIARMFVVPVVEHEDALNGIGVIPVDERDRAVDAAYKAGMSEGRNGS